MELAVRDRIILTLSSAGLIISTLLVINEYRLAGYNPSLGAVPACHLFANAFILIILSIVVVKDSIRSLLFVSGITLGIPVSIYFSVTHLFMINPSPLFYDIPASYIFTVLFTAVAVVRYLVIRR